MTIRYVGSYGTARLLFRSNGWRFGFFPSSFGSRYPTVAFHFSRLRARLRSSLHSEVRVDGLFGGGVELGLHMRLSPMDLSQYAPLFSERNVVWEGLFSSYETRQLFEAKGSRFGFLLATSGRLYLTGAFQFSHGGAW